MANVDMCEHEWPGSGCKQCKAEASKGLLTLDQVMDSLKKAIDDGAIEGDYVDNLGDGESIIIDGTINIAILHEELNQCLRKPNP